MCSKIVFSVSTVIIPDTSNEECFANDPLLQQKGIRFYAGTPIKTQGGKVVGSLCVMDTRPRNITEHQSEQLALTAEVVMTAIEMHRLETPETVSDRSYIASLDLGNVSEDC